MVLLWVQIDAEQCIAILRPIHNLQASKELSMDSKPPHTSVTSSANQTATVNSTLDDVGTIQAALLQGRRCRQICLLCEDSEPLATSHHLLRAQSQSSPCMSSSPTLASGPSAWITLHNHCSEPVTLRAGHQVGTVEATEVVVSAKKTDSGASMSSVGLVPRHLSPLQQ